MLAHYRLIPNVGCPACRGRVGRYWPGRLSGQPSRARPSPGMEGREARGLGWWGGANGGAGETVAGIRGNEGGGGGAGRQWKCYCLISNVGTNAHVRSKMKVVNDIFRFLQRCAANVMVKCGRSCKS